MDKERRCTRNNHCLSTIIEIANRIFQTYLQIALMWGGTFILLTVCSLYHFAAQEFTFKFSSKNVNKQNGLISYFVSIRVTMASLNESQQPKQEKKLTISSDASTIIETCRNKDVNDVPKCFLISDCSLPDPPNQLRTQQLSPLDIRKGEAFHSNLQETCLSDPIVLIRGLSQAVEFDLSLFETKALVKTNPDMNIEGRKQIRSFSNENWNEERTKKVWTCYSSNINMTVRKYATYQKEFLKKIKENDKENNKENISNKVSDSDSSSRTTKCKNVEWVKFATNIDISAIQSVNGKRLVDELAKLPPFLRVKCDENMLSYVGYEISGMNTVQLYMKVPGCRTPGHQENNNFCSVNINIGPGDCEWFAVPNEYWGALHSLCKQNNVDYLSGSWWPSDLDTLRRKNIPVYRFYQKAGDIVWVNVGCVHWVQAIGCCNNIAWNVGPFTAEQYQLALERYEWNKLQAFKSIVPMVHLSWNLARNIKVSDPQLFELIKNCLLRTMNQCCSILDFVKSKNMKVRFHGRKKNEAAHYCGQCEIEVFNILFVRKQEKLHVVHCMDCARKQSPALQGFVCLEEYCMRDLMDVYDGFTMPLITTSSSSSLSVTVPTTLQTQTDQCSRFS